MSGHSSALHFAFKGASPAGLERAAAVFCAKQEVEEVEVEAKQWLGREYSWWHTTQGVGGAPTNTTIEIFGTSEEGRSETMMVPCAV